MSAEQTWTFVGHWEGDEIVVEYVLPGEQQDDRIDVGHWPEGLWAASGSGATVEEAQATVVAEYEAEYAEEPEDGIHLDIDPMLFFAAVIEEQIEVMDMTDIAKDAGGMLGMADMMSGVGDIARHQIEMAQESLDRLIAEDTTWRPL
jgi:hypothetical protein